MLLEQCAQDIPSLVRATLNAIDSREVEIGLVESGRDPDALLELLNGLVAAVRAEI
jgi:hypothetical protein